MMNKSKITLLAFVIFGLATLIFIYNKKTNSISKDGIETVAKITGFDGGHATSGPSIFYDYHVDKTNYKGSMYIKSSSKYPHKFYYITYSSKKPEWSEIHLNRPVTDTAKIKAAGFSLLK